MSIDTLVVESNGSVRPRFMQSHLSLRKPRPYSERYVQSLDSRINDLGFVATTQPVVVEFTPHSATLYAYLESAKANRANGLLAFGTDEGGKLQLQGEANIFLANMFKGGEELSLSWSSPDKNMQLLNVGVRLPYLLFGTAGVNALFEMERRDTLYLSLHGRGGLSSRAGSYGTATLFADMQRHNNRTAASPQGSKVTALLYGADYALRHTDNLLFPRSGCTAYASLAVGTRTVEAGESTTGANLEGAADLACHAAFGKRMSLMLRAQGKVKRAFANGEGETLYQSELYAIGGANTLRGFNERSLLTAAYAIATVEPQLYFSRQGYLSAFCDYAPIKKEGSAGGSLSHLLSFGVGTRFAIGAGIFSLSYALGKADGSRFVLKNAKVHVGYTVVF
jgi:outer membrane protein assembly factor BamA